MDVGPHAKINAVKKSDRIAFTVLMALALSLCLLIIGLLVYQKVMPMSPQVTIDGLKEAVSGNAGRILVGRAVLFR